MKSENQEQVSRSSIAFHAELTHPNSLDMLLRIRRNLMSIRATLVFVFVTFFSLSSIAAIDKKPIVFVRTIELIELSETLTYPARVEPRIKASVVAEADGVVTKIIAPLGSKVATRSKLLVIKNTDPVYQYSPMVVTAPVSGVVSRVDVTEGSRVSRGDKLALVTDPDQVRVVVEITAEDVRSIEPGQEAELKVPGSANEPVRLRVRGVSPFVDPATGTASAELEVAKGAKTSQLPPPGVIARVFFRANVRKGISVPDTALTYRGKDPYVRIVIDKKAKLVPVSIGRKQAGQVEIIKGLKKGDVLVERTSKFIAEGEEVEVQSKEKPADGQSASNSSPQAKGT